MLYSIVMGFATHQPESAIDIYVSPPFGTLLLPPSPLSLTFRSSIYFEFIFVYGAEEYF